MNLVQRNRRLGLKWFVAAIALGVAIQWVSRSQRRPNKQPAAATRMATVTENNRPSFSSPQPPLSEPISSARDQIVTAPKPSTLEARAQADALLDGTLVPRIHLEIPAGGITRLKIQPRIYVKATLTEGDRVYTNVAVHLKGGPGSFRDVDDRPSFTLNFDKFAEGQTFHGLKKIHLNSSLQDPSLLSEKICRELFNAAGVPAPRAGHSVLTFNQKAMGVYVVLEGVNKQFLKRHFADASGNVYDGHSQADVTQRMPTNDGDEPKDQTRLKALAAAVREPDLDRRRTALESTLDVDRFLSFMALETLLWHWDGYTLHRNNFRVFHDRTADRMVFLPHGMDQMVSRADAPLVPRAEGAVAKAVLEVPELKERYWWRVAEIATNHILGNAITTRIRQVAKDLEVVMEQTDPAAVRGQRRRTESLCRRFVQRAASVEAQLAKEGYLATATGVKLPDLTRAEWLSRVDLGEAELREDSDPEGRELLMIQAKTPSTASWRHRVLLSRGRYRLEGTLRMQDVELDLQDPRAGAGLRLSRSRAGQKNHGNRDWTPVFLEFEVAQERAEVELICELRAIRGTIWFDRQEFRLSKF